MRRTANLPCGFINVAKPSAVTSHDVVSSVRKILRLKQVGHGGTLDPLASGVLPIAVGKATRLLRFLQSGKTYLARIRFGVQTTTDDTEGEIIEQWEKIPTEEDIRHALPKFMGIQQQVPPLYSAIHVDGKRLYELARAGIAPSSVPAREVQIHSIEFISFQPPELEVRVSCSAGTYIRSIARDLGSQLGIGACLSGLVREQAGPFALEQAHTLDELKDAMASQALDGMIVSPVSVLKLQSIAVDDTQAKKLTQGQSLSITVSQECAEPTGEHVLALCDGKLIAVCSRQKEDASAFKIQPEVVLADEHQAS